MSYYFISIGGSGTRVLESLAHLSLAGLLPNKERDGYLYTMAIDPDTGNGNLSRTHTLLTSMDGFQRVKVGQGTPLFKTQLELPKDFTWSPTPLGATLDSVIFYQNYKDTPVGKLYEALYTEKERTTVLDVGFRGRPSIGAAVMGMKAAADVATPWQNFVEKVNSDVNSAGVARIFLSGSVFGGTGAAGLPTVARLLREIFKKHIEKGKVRIGGALLLPYFSFTPNKHQKKNSGIFASSDNFLTNTKAALRYYADIGNENYDCMYFVGDETMNPTPNFSVGSKTQRNDAHIVDFFASLAAIDFYRGTEGRHCYFVSKEQDDVFSWQDLPYEVTEDGTKVSVRDRFVQFTRFIFAWLYSVKPYLKGLEDGSIKLDGHPWYDNYWKNQISTRDDDVKNFDQYTWYFMEWLNQVEHSAGRPVELINPKSFMKDGKVSIDPELFGEMDYGRSEIYLDGNNGLIGNLAGGEKKGLLKKIASSLGADGGGKKSAKDSAAGFGLFLRRLYDSCAAKNE